MDINKGDDFMSIDNDVCIGKFVFKYVCLWSWELGFKYNLRMIFFVDTGEFFLIEIIFEFDDFSISLFDCFYYGFFCRVLLWIEGGFLVVIVDMGDGMFFKLEDGRLDYLSFI